MLRLGRYGNTRIVFTVPDPDFPERVDRQPGIELRQPHPVRGRSLVDDIHRDVCKAYGLYWHDLNVATRGTVVIGKDASGQGKVKWIQSREPGKAMSFDEVLAHM